MSGEPSHALEVGGLRFAVSFRAPAGATLRVDGMVDGFWQEVVRFDDFVEDPHFHVPADGPAISFDRSALGAPLDWYIRQIRDHLPELLTDAGFPELVPGVDVEAVHGAAAALRQAMVACVPAGYARVPGIGLQRIDAEADR